MNLYLSKASGPDCIPVVVLKSCKPELSYILAQLFNQILRSTAKNYCLVTFLSVLSNVFKKLVSNRLVTQTNVVFFLISSMVLGLLNQLQILSQLYLIELLGLITGLGLLQLWHLIYPRFLTGFDMLFVITNLSLMEFQARYLHLFLLFSVIDSLRGSGWKVFTKIFK